MTQLLFSNSIKKYILMSLHRCFFWTITHDSEHEELTVLLYDAKQRGHNDVHKENVSLVQVFVRTTCVRQRDRLS